MRATVRMIESEAIEGDPMSMSTVEERAVIVRQRRPTRIIENAVRGMLPKTKLGKAMYRKLKVYAGPEHPHAAQMPTKYEVA